MEAVLIQGFALSQCLVVGERLRLPVNPYLAKSICRRRVHPVSSTPPPIPVYLLTMISMQVTVPSSSRVSGASWSWAVLEVAAVGPGDRGHHQPHSRDSLWCTQGHQFIKEQNPILERTWVHRQDIRVQILSLPFPSSVVSVRLYKLSEPILHVACESR